MYNKEKYIIWNEEAHSWRDPFKMLAYKAKSSANTGTYGGNNASKMRGMRDENGKLYSYHNPKLDPKTGKKYGVKEYNLDAEYLEKMWRKQKGMCYWMNIPMKLEDLLVSNSPWAPSVDRLDNDKGYLKGNVVLATSFANRGRGSYNEVSDLSFKRTLRKLMREAV